MSSLLGSQSGLAHPLSVALASVAVAGLVACCWRGRGRGLDTLRLLLLLWFVLPIAALTVGHVAPQLHYLIVLYPIPLFGVAFALERLWKLRRELAVVAVAACLGCLAYLDARFLQTVVDHGGAPGGYGVGYTYKAEAARLIVRENAQRAFVLSTDVDKDPRDYQPLVWNERHDDTLGAAVRGEVVSSFVDSGDELLRRAREVPESRTARAGPLVVVSVPLRECASKRYADTWLCQRLER
jgi:hypothetical protein